MCGRWKIRQVSTIMAARASDTKTCIGNSKKLFCRGDGLSRILISFCLLVALFVGATSDLARSAGYGDRAAAELPVDNWHDAVPCDDGLICAANILTQRLGERSSDIEHSAVLISANVPRQKFTTPQVDLPPPRTAV